MSVARVVYFRFSWVVNKVTTRQTSHANDFVNIRTLKAMQERNFCSQGIGAYLFLPLELSFYNMALKLLKNVCVRGYNGFNVV